MKPHKIYGNITDGKTLSQFYDAMKQDFVVKGALMPDAHAGYALPIGAVVATEGVVVPAWVGYDIGCGMLAVPTNFDSVMLMENQQAIFDDLYKAIPVGFNHNKVDSKWDRHRLWPCTEFMQETFAANGLKQLGSLGGGNHFIEIGLDWQSTVWVVIHSGSRNLGHRTATQYMRLASNSNKAKEGHYPLCVDSYTGKDYIKDMKFCLEFALQNRLEMLSRVERVLTKYGVGWADRTQLINRNHNHAEEKNGLWIHRKGATHAEAGMMGVIPANMAHGTMIVEGKGNTDSLCSSSHGAGRVMSRAKAKETIDLDDFILIMQGVTANVTQSTIDESPFAYKDIETVMCYQKDLVEVKNRIFPIINIKG